MTLIDGKAIAEQDLCGQQGEGLRSVRFQVDPHPI